MTVTWPSRGCYIAVMSPLHHRSMHVTRRGVTVTLPLHYRYEARRRGCTALHEAARRGLLTTLTWLLEARAVLTSSLAHCLTTSLPYYRTTPRPDYRRTTEITCCLAASLPYYRTAHHHLTPLLPYYVTTLLPYCFTTVLLYYRT